MKICFLVDSYLPDIGGLQYSVHYLAESLVKKGCIVTIIAKISRERNPIPEHQYHLIRYGYRFPGSGRTGLDNLSAVWKTISEHLKKSFDILHCHNVTYAANRAVLVKGFVNVPLVMTPHGDDIEFVPEFNYGMRLNKGWDRLIRKNILKADLVTAINDQIRKELDYLPPERIKEIPNGINLDVFSSKRSGYLHEVLKIDPKSKIILSTGRNHIIKGYEFGIKAFEKIAKNEKYKDLVYVIVGKNCANLATLAPSPLLNQRIFFVENQEQENLAKCYQSSWCFFSPSIIEGFSLVSLEAMASGLPMVLTDVAGNNDVKRRTGCGTLVKSQDPESMSDGIKTLYDKKEYYNMQRQKGIEKVQDFTWDDIAEQYIKAYTSVLESK